MSNLTLKCACIHDECTAEIRFSFNVDFCWITSLGTDLDIVLYQKEIIDLRDWLSDQIESGGVSSVEKGEIHE